MPVPRVSKVTGSIHGLERLQHQSTWDGKRRLVHKPARQARACKILAATDDVCLGSSTLEGGPGIFDGESSIAQNCNTRVGQLIIRSVVIHAITNFAPKIILSRVFNNPVPCQTSRIMPNDTSIHLLLLSFVLQVVNYQLVISLLAALVPDNFHLRNVGPEADVRKDTKLLCCDMEVSLDLPLVGPHAPAILFRIVSVLISAHPVHIPIAIWVINLA
mmetsp:Transcript_104065/g.180832  ORF Transcript_104065/g.180832 Transcript_104065/m.180832 type:complete len:217 (+) Transcript_104065:911-1561(+)